MEMLLQPREQIERLQTVDLQRLEKVVIRRKVLAGNLEVRGGKSENLAKRLVLSWHTFYAVTVPFGLFNSNIRTITNATRATAKNTSKSQAMPCKLSTIVR